MTWNTDNLPDAVKNKSKEVIQAYKTAFNSALSKGLTQDESLFSALNAAKIKESKESKASVKKVVPQHVQAILNRTLQVPENKEVINRAFLGKSALPPDQERTLVAADFNDKNQLVLTFDTGEKITTNAPDIEQNIEQYLSVSAGLSNPVDYIEFNQLAGLTVTTGQLTWNDTDGTLDLGLKGGNVTLQIGQEQLVRFVNHTDAAFIEMQVVRVLGAQGNRLSAALAQANSDVNSKSTFAIVTEPIPKNQQGYATTSGLVRNIDTSAFPEGSVLYLSNTIPGGITNTVPTSPSRTVRVGYCVRSHQNLGSIFVHIVNDVDLNELHDVLIQAPQDGQVLAYDSSMGLWRNTVQGGSASQEEEVLSKRTDFVGETTIYKGEAQVGASESAAIWRIRQLTIGTDGDVTEIWAGGTALYDKVWTDRLTYVYS